MYDIIPLVPPYELPHWGVMENVFDAEEVDRIRFYEKILEFSDGKTLGMQHGEIDEAQNREIRSCQQAILPHDQNTAWLWQKIGHLAGKANYDLFLYDIRSIECLQYTVYDGTTSDHYMFHRDSHLSGYRKYDRKITGILMLSDEDEYEGGELQVDIEGSLDPSTMNLKKGDLLFFDSNYSHSVLPVKSGTRKTLVFWVWGSHKL